MNERTSDELLSENQRLQAELDEIRSRLANAERLFFALNEGISDIVFTTLPDGSWDYASARIYEITGLPAGAALGNGWTKALHPDDLERVVSEVHESIISRTPLESHFRLQSCDGSHRRFIARAHFVCDETGEIARWIGTATDVHDFLTAEDALHNAKREANESVGMLVHDLRNLIAPIQYAVVLLQNPNSDGTQTRHATEMIEKQMRALRAFFEKMPATPRA